MRSVSTTRRSRLVTSHSTLDAVARSSWLSAGHSACQAPAARSSSWLPAACSSVATRPGTCIAAARALTAAIGLCLCGIDDDPPLPSARSASSPMSLCARTTMSRATLATAAAASPHAPATAAVAVRWV